MHDTTLDSYRAETLEFNERFLAGLPKEQYDLTTPEGRVRARSMDGWNVGPEGPPLALPIDERVVSFGGHSVPVRIVRPRAGAVRAVVLDIHGGGFFLGSAAMSDRKLVGYAERLGFAGVSVDYRLAPEHPYPAAPDDCVAVARWLLANSVGEFGAATLFIEGGSAGATLAVKTLLRLRECGEPLDRFAGANLVFGLYDLAAATPGGRILHKHSHVYIDAYLSAVPVADRAQPEISTIFADLRGMPPALFTIGTLDPFYEDNLAMAMRWAAAGSSSELAVYPDALHGFTSFPTAMGRAANEKIRRWMNESVG